MAYEPDFMPYEPLLFWHMDRFIGGGVVFNILMFLQRVGSQKAMFLGKVWGLLHSVETRVLRKHPWEREERIEDFCHPSHKHYILKSRNLFGNQSGNGNSN